MAMIDGYRHVGGTHPETAGLANMLAALGVTAPHTAAPYSEAMLLGLGGGLGAGYILWEFKAHGVARVLVLGFGYRWQYPLEYLQSLCRLLGATPVVHETGSRAAAAAGLQQAMERGSPALAWVDRALMPYLQLPAALQGHIGHLVTVCGMEDDAVLVDDLAALPLHVARDAFADARARITSYKHRLLLVEPPAARPDLAGLIVSGLRTCVDHLSQPSDSFSLPAFRKWARLMTATRSAKGWPVVFADGRGLFGTLLSMFEAIELVDNDSGALRGLYASFLDEARTVVSLPALDEAAAQYRALATMWSALADAALPDQVAPLREAKTLFRRRHRLLMAQGDAALPAMRPLTERLAELSAEHNRVFPLPASATADLFAVLQQKLVAIYEAERSAIATLAGAVA